jgi:uncharacterized membrane protein YkvA (DUF1232 family)
MHSSIQSHFRQFLHLIALLRDPRAPKMAKALPLISLLYVLFPFDIIPDLIPILGQLDDALIAPFLIFLALRMIYQRFGPDLTTEQPSHPKSTPPLLPRS